MNGISESSPIKALERLYAIAQKDSGQPKIVAGFLAHLYNGDRCPFNLVNLRSLDHQIFEDRMSVLRLDACAPQQEIHEYFVNGGQKFETMIERWALDGEAGIEYRRSIRDV